MRELDTHELATLALEKCCPFCGGNRFFEGPHGGMSVNWYCAQLRCGAGFNLPPEPMGFGQLIAGPGTDVRAWFAGVIEAAAETIFSLEQMNPPVGSAEAELLAGLRGARDRYLAGAKPLRFGPPQLDPEVIVHVLHGGFPLCRFSAVAPSSWPDGHLWVRSEEAAQANCAGCLEYLSAGGGGDISAQK